MNATKPIATFGWQHYSIGAAGIFLLVVILLADKTALKEKAPASMPEKMGEPETSTGSNNNASSQNLLQSLAPLPADKVVDSLVQVLPKAEGKEKATALKSLAERLLDLHRPDAAAVYAEELYTLDPTIKNLVVAGALYRNAANALVEDSILFRTLSNNSIRLLNEAVAKDSTNEDASLELGLAYIQSKSLDAMLGINRLVSILEKNPDNEEVAFELGNYSMSVGKFDRAEVRFRTVLRINPKNVLAKFNLALALKEEGKAAESDKLMKEVAKQNENPQLAEEAKKYIGTH